MNLPKYIKLYDAEKNEDFSVSIGKLNGIRFSEISEKEKQFRDVKKEANLLVVMANSNPELLRENIKGLEDEAQMNQMIDGIIKNQYSLEEVTNILESSIPDIAIINMHKRIEIIKIMIDDTNLSEDHRKMIYSEPTSDFWKNQNILELQEVADLFRGLLRK